MLSSELMATMGPLLGTAPPGVRWRDLLSTAISTGLSNGSFVKGHHYLQPIGALVMERQVAHAISARLALGDAARLMARSDVDVVIDDVFALDGVDLNPEQRSAIHLAASHAFVCITGGAGVGKTTVLKALYHLYDRVGVHVIQVALAGRAAKRMQEATGRAASTIAGFLKANQEDTLGGPTVLVIDEASMVDIISMSRICVALPAHVRLVLVGDPHQLMPVGPGLILHAIQKVTSAPAVELKTVKRYGGDIAAAATAVRAGQWPSLSSDETAPAAFLECEDALIAELVVELYALDAPNTQVLSPVRNGLSGTKHLNGLSQQRFTKERLPVKCWNEEFECEEHCGFHDVSVGSTPS
jgi:exodeoxyribonuclease V alpha subunit